MSVIESMTMSRAEALRVLREWLTDEAVIVSLGHPAYDLYAAGDRDLTFYTWGSMGLTSSIALGLAIGRPDKTVVAVDGDGSLLMNLGSLATIGARQPQNLIVLVLDNGLYGTTGGQPTFTANGADLAATARALGIEQTRTVASLDALRQALHETRLAPGPWVLVAKVSESRPTAKPPLDCHYIRRRFMEALG